MPRRSPSFEPPLAAEPPLEPEPLLAPALPVVARAGRSAAVRLGAMAALAGAVVALRAAGRG